MILRIHTQIYWIVRLIIGILCPVASRLSIYKGYHKDTIYGYVQTGVVTQK